MKKILLLLVCAYSVTNCTAQQKELDSLLNQLKKHPQEDTVRLKILLDVAYSYSRVDASKGLSVANQTIAMAKNLRNLTMEAKAYNYAAQNCQTLGNDSLAIAYCLLSLKIKEKLKDSSGIGVSFHTMAVSFFNRTEYSKALENEEKSKQIFERRKDTFRLAAATNSLGVDNKYLGNYPEALRDFQQAIYLWSKTGDSSHIGNSLQNSGLVYSSLHNYKLALDYYRKALVLAQSAGNIINMADVYGNMANAYDDMHDTLLARTYLNKDLALSQQSNYTFGVAAAMGNLGISYLNSNELDKAICYLQSGLEKFITLHSDANEAGMINKLSKAYLLAPNALLRKYNVPVANKYDYIIKHQQQGVALAKKTKSIKELQDAYESLSSAYEAKKDYKNALIAHKQYVVYKDSLINDNTKQQITRIGMQYEFSKTEDSIKAVNDKQQAISKTEIQKQHVIETSTMAGAGFLILAGISGFAFYKRNRDIRIQKNEAELKSQITDTEMKALRAQMNPHFIFNSLNSIADYIDKNQTKIASDFTTKFARLMRMVLENSEHKAIPLADDLKALELYIQLEQLRLKNKFSYVINVDEKIDKENTLMPPLILQPFVENSIWHGIAKKESNGYITINILQDGKMINCIVEDDGGGIQEKEFISEKKSLGMKITKERIDVLNKLKNTDASITNASISVLNKEKGVRAEVKLPLELSF